MMELIKKDIAGVISKYMKIDTDQMEIMISTRKGNQRDAKAPVLCANIPILDFRK